MVDVGGKAETRRVARATGTIRMQPATLAAIAGGSAKKGDVLGVARIAAIQGAKRTSELVPLCHPLPLTHVQVEFALDTAASAVHCTVQAETLGRTGVEMEALTAVQVGPADRLRHGQGDRPRHGDGEHPRAGEARRQVGVVERGDLSPRDATRHEKARIARASCAAVSGSRAR